MAHVGEPSVTTDRDCGCHVLPDDEPGELKLPGPEDGAVEAPHMPRQAPPVDPDLDVPAGIHDGDGVE